MATTLTSLLNGGIDPGDFGTGKRLGYAMLSYNTSSTWYGYALYDQTFKMSFNTATFADTLNTYGPGLVVQVNNGTYSYGGACFANVNATQTRASSNGTSSYMNATNAYGEFGNALVDVYSDGTISTSYARGDWTYKYYLNGWAINSDHSDKRIVYLMYNGVIRAVDRLYGNPLYAMEGTADYTVTSLNSNMQGSASYHATRKELTILSYSSSGGQFNVITFQNVDFNLYPNPAVALARPEVVRVNSTVSLASNWNNNNSESFYNLKPIVTNNGKVYVSVMFTSQNFTLYEFTRSGTSAVTATYVTTQNLTTSYGIEQAFYYGQRQITSRDGTAVCTFCTYYYYGSGARAYMIDKTNNTYTIYSNSSSSDGVAIMPWSNNGWLFIPCGNVYSSNYTGASGVVYGRAPSGGFQVINPNMYFTHFTGPNTTNYPGYTQTTDFALLTYNQNGPKS